MIINKNAEPRSSFLSVDKDLGIIANRMYENTRLKKLLFWDSADALSKPDLTDEQTLSLFEKNIKIIPQIPLENTANSYIIISFNHFVPSENPEFRDNIIEFDIICNYDQWPLKDFQLRPFKIAAEIDSMFNNQRFSGIGKLRFIGGKHISTSDTHAGLCLIYEAVHGEDDKIGLDSPYQMP